MRHFLRTYRLYRHDRVRPASMLRAAWLALSLPF